MNAKAKKKAEASLLDRIEAGGLHQANQKRLVASAMSFSGRRCSRCSACRLRRRPIGRLAQQMVLKPQRASGFADRLGLVRRECADADRRRNSLRLSDKAHQHLATLSAVRRDQIRRFRPTLEAILASIG